MRPCLSQSLICNRRWEHSSQCQEPLLSFPLGSPRGHSPYPDWEGGSQGSLVVRVTGYRLLRQEGESGPHFFPASNIDSQRERELGVPQAQHFTTHVAGTLSSVRCYLKKDFSCEKCWEMLHSTCPPWRGTWAKFKPLVWKNHDTFPCVNQNTNNINH